MSEPMIRGQVIAHTASFLRSQLDSSTARRLEDELSAELRITLGEIVPALWYPRRYQVELLDALVTVKGKGEPAYADLVRCGAGFATVENDFTKLLMKILTTELFFKKLSRFWLRDHQNSGNFEVQALENIERGVQLRLGDVAGYNHSAVLWLGWMQHVLQRLSGPASHIEQTGWSWSNPGPNHVVYQVEWS